MTDPLTQHEQLKREQQRIARELEKLEQDEGYRKAVAFKQDISDVLRKHDKTFTDLLEMFGKDVPSSSPRTSTRKPRRSQPLKRYTNPHTGDVVEAKSLRKPELQAWKKEYGEEEVKSWGKVIEDPQAPTKTS